MNRNFGILKSVSVSEAIFDSGGFLLLEPFKKFFPYTRIKKGFLYDLRKSGPAGKAIHGFRAH